MSTTDAARHGISLRPVTAADVDAAASICFNAFGTLNARHNFPNDFPSVDAVRGLMQYILSLPEAVYGVVAQDESGRVVGSNFLWEVGAVAGVGPITVDPSAQSRAVGRRLMEAVIERARQRNIPSVRLVQAAFNTTSMTLYTKLGFDVREPLVCLQAPQGAAAALPRVDVSGYAVRPATEADLEPCAALCRRVHGHDRTPELAAKVAQGTAAVVERDGQITGYASEVGFFGHAVGQSNYELMALIGAAEQISGPGLLLPSRNGELFRWCLGRRGLRMVQPMTLMSLGLYNEPRGAFLPSVLF